MGLKEIDGIYVSEHALDKFCEFEKHYLDVRAKEHRILSVGEIKQLPFVDKGSEYYREWKFRRKSIHRFFRYLDTKKSSLRILDIGCGNGFFANLLAMRKHDLVGVDVSLSELKRAALTFPDKNLKWYCLDLMSEPLPEEKFDIIAFNASFQYFKAPEKILEVCKNYLKSNGEIHVLDSPFYDKETILEAQERSKRYYQSIGAPQMNSHYFHHDIKVLSKFNPQFMYKPNNRWFKFQDSPFPWIKIAYI